MWLIWSNEHDAWWGPNRSGYYTNIDRAGRYDLAAANLICIDAGTLNRVKQDPSIPAEVVVPSPELIQSMIGIPDPAAAIRAAREAMKAAIGEVHAFGLNNYEQTRDVYNKLRAALAGLGGTA